MLPFLRPSRSTNSNSEGLDGHPTSVSATTSMPSRHKTGTRLATSPSALKSLLAPYTDQEQTDGPDSSLIQANQHLPRSDSIMPKSPPVNDRIATDPIQRSASPMMAVRNAWQYIPFLTKQATNIATSFVSHHLVGPPKKSWGIEMTIFTSMVREMANYSHLSSIHQLRKLMDYSQILPTPKDGIVTPVLFKVKPENLTGFLKELDSVEDGSRTLTGEWVLSKKTWIRMQTESLNRRRSSQIHHDHDLDHGFQSPTTLANPQHGLGNDKVIYFIHGGAYCIMSAATHRSLTISIAKYTECRIFAINYRLAPETKFPGPLHDVVLGYFRLLNDLSIPAQNIVFAGDSAGGGLVMALLMYLRDEHYPLPSAAMLFSPWCDLTMSCDSWETNQPYDFLPMPRADDPLHPVKCYLGEEGIKKWITHPYVSPLFGDMHGLPPLLIQAGDAEVLRDEITLLAHKASLHGVKVTHEIYEDCVHVFQAFLFLESSTKALQSMRHYIRHVLPKIDRLSDHQQSSDLLTSEESPYRPTARPPSSDDAESTYSSEDPYQGAVDREISRDAHLVNDMSQTIKQTLPPTPAVPNFLGSEDDEVSDSEEVLSADDDSGEEDEVLDASAEPTSPSQAHDQHQTTDSLGSAVSTSTLSLHPENRKTGLSLRCRLPPAMDLKAIQDLILSPSRRERSWETEAPSGLRSPTSLKEDSRRMSESNSTCSFSRRTSLQPAPMVSIQSNASSRVLPTSPTDQQDQPPSTSGVSSHVRRQSFHQSAIRPHKFTASNVALLTPMVRAHDHGGPSTVTADLQAIFHDLITTPSELRTTVYTQGDDDDDEDDDDQNGHDVSPNQQHLRTYNFSDLNRQLHHQQTISSTNTSIPIHSPTSSLPVHNHSKLPSDDHYIPPTPDFAFQTPGYGFF
ncbi:hypothetical protein MJO28_007383 [Puccinia striiformis f. sp. tritici]|uniref:Uncharacterized protein n=3 Tax=Puccinia striiformis TaxID=27350 RepID=A0A2S4WAR7_9BASI|nr:hypothetical protein MJO28_007383 [Puccinia striiformis f. sp. tritici]POW10107.1 hypothetical protein PSTT_06328 [Puccinia striiformis]POW18865.1 hypothetical protein PSHT_05335 [Puccinia striiformis]